MLQTLLLVAEELPEATDEIKQELAMEAEKKEAIKKHNSEIV